jgi:hypothetical protein
MNFIRLVSNSWQSQVECEALPQERIAPAFVLFVTSVIGSASRVNYMALEQMLKLYYITHLLDLTSSAR